MQTATHPASSLSIGPIATLRRRPANMKHLMLKFHFHFSTIETGQSSETNRRTELSLVLGDT